jgi:biotin carboxyl carrier protein
MKWKISEPQAQRAKGEAGPTSNSTPHSNVYEVEVPESIRQQRPRPGETFVLSLRPTSNNESASPALDINCSFVGDGKSLKIGDRIVRLARVPQAQKKGIIRFRAGVLDVVKDYLRVVERVRPVAPLRAAHAAVGGDLCAPMTGKVVKVNVVKGQSVVEGECLVVIEAMKMENQIRSECDGVVTRVEVQEGGSIKIGDAMLSVDPKGGTK